MSVNDANKMFCRTLGHMWNPVEWLAHRYEFQNTGRRSYRKFKNKCKGSYCHRCQELRTDRVGRRKYTRRVAL